MVGALALCFFQPRSITATYAPPSPQVKVVVRGEGDGVSAVRLELASENNVFFHYTHGVDAGAFAKLRHEQRLMVELQAFPQMLVRMFNQASGRRGRAAGG